MAGHFPDKIKMLPPFDGRFNAHKLEANGADVLFASYPAGTKIPEHSHETHNYGIITRGELILTMQGEVTRFGIGDWYNVPAGIKHTAMFELETDEIEFWFRPDKS